MGREKNPLNKNVISNLCFVNMRAKFNRMGTLVLRYFYFAHLIIPKDFYLITQLDLSMGFLFNFDI